MAKNSQPQANDSQKIVTKYDRKMEERKKKEEKDKRDAKVMRIGAIVIGAAAIVAIVGSIAASVLNKNAAIKNTYVTIGDHQLTKLEYDYYFNSTVFNYVNSYSDYLGLLGLDVTKDLDEQPFSNSESLTWKDNFDQMTVQQIQRTKAIVDDAKANNFTYDTNEDYKTAMESIKISAETSGITVADYYKSTYGSYATEKNIEPFVKEDLLVSAYFDEMLANNTPTEDEVKNYYAENTQNYDKIDYRNFILKAEYAEEATDEEKEKAMAEAKEKADAMMAARQEGADFKELCLANASEEDKATFEDAETDASLNEGKYFIGTSGTISEWLFEEGRAEGDITVIEDQTNHQYFVVEFINRYYDEADNANISNTIANEKVGEHIESLLGKYAVVDNKGDLKYLTVDMSTDAANETEAVAEETENAEEEDADVVPAE